MDKTDNRLRAVFKSELTWLVMIVGTVWAVVTGVILPLNTVQLQLANLQLDVSALKSDHDIIVVIRNKLNL